MRLWDLSSFLKSFKNKIRSVWLFKIVLRLAEALAKWFWMSFPFPDTLVNSIRRKVIRVHLCVCVCVCVCVCAGACACVCTHICPWVRVLYFCLSMHLCVSKAVSTLLSACPCFMCRESDWSQKTSRWLIFIAEWLEISSCHPIHLGGTWTKLQGEKAFWIWFLFICCCFCYTAF